MTDHWPLPATRGITFGARARNLRDTLRNTRVRRAIVEDAKWLYETGESPQIAAIRLGKTRTALVMAMRVAKEPELVSWFDNAYEASCTDCGTPIRGDGKSGMCYRCATRESALRRRTPKNARAKATS